MEPAEPLFATKSDAGRESLSAGERLTLDFIILRELTTQTCFGRRALYHLKKVKMDNKQQERH